MQSLLVDSYKVLFVNKYLNQFQFRWKFYCMIFLSRKEWHFHQKVIDNELHLINLLDRLTDLLYRVKFLYKSELDWTVSCLRIKWDLLLSSSAPAPLCSNLLIQLSKSQFRNKRSRADVIISGTPTTTRNFSKLIDGR